MGEELIDFRKLRGEEPGELFAFLVEKDHGGEALDLILVRIRLVLFL